jgi:hypothetical protein
VAELLHEHFPDHLTQARPDRDHGHRRLAGVSLARQRELRDLALQLGDDVLRLLRADPRKRAQVLLVLARDGRRQLPHRRRERPGGDHGPMSFTVMSLSKNSLSRSLVNPISTGRG